MTLNSDWAPHHHPPTLPCARLHAPDSATPSFICPVARSSPHSLTHSLTLSRAHSLTHSFTHSLTHSLTHSSCRVLAQSLTYSLTHVQCSFILHKTVGVMCIIHKVIILMLACLVLQGQLASWQVQRSWHSHPSWLELLSLACRYVHAPQLIHFLKRCAALHASWLACFLLLFASASSSDTSGLALRLGTRQSRDICRA